MDVKVVEGWTIGELLGEEWRWGGETLIEAPWASTLGVLMVIKW